MEMRIFGVCQVPLESGGFGTCKASDFLRVFKTSRLWIFFISNKGQKKRGQKTEGVEKGPKETHPYINAFVFPCRCDGSIDDFRQPCFPIMYPSHVGECTTFIRSASACQTNKNIVEPRQQLNMITSYLDGSVVYGSSKKQADKLRFLNGKVVCLSCTVILYCIVMYLEKLFIEI